MPYKDRARRREYQREAVARRRREWLDENGPCSRCGSTFRLEVDHVDPATKVDHRVWSWARPRMLAELAKCQVLCRVCHEAKTAMQPTRARGERNGAKLTEETVLRMRSLRSEGWSWGQLAAHFGISKDAARWAAARGWKHLD